MSMRGARQTYLTRFAIVCLIFRVVLAGPHAAEAPPAWLVEAARRPLPQYDARVPAVVLLNERRATVSDAGKVTISIRRAIRILARNGASEARAAEVYTSGASTVRVTRGWMIAPSGEDLKLNKENEYDRPYSPNNDLYSDVRVHGLDASRKADPGSVFGYESVIDETPLFAQFEWSFQWQLPCLVSRFVLTLPAGWHAAASMVNSAALVPTVDGTTSTWELRNLPYIESEPARPELDSLVPRIAISYYPAAGAGASLPVAFSAWSDVSKWLFALNDPPAEPDDAISSKTREVVAGAHSDFQKIQAIGYFVRSIKYISIQTGVGRGGGYRPHTAGEVFRNAYGDCKDKAALMRAMLKAAGIVSYPVFLNATDRDYVREEWPSPEQFNHAIVAVRVSSETQAPAVIDHPALGRLLIVDPTNPLIPPGELPMVEQGGLALVAAVDKSALVRLPMTSSEANLTEGEIHASLSATGMLTATVEEAWHGYAAVAPRCNYYGRTRPDFDKSIEEWVAENVTGAAVSRIEPADSSYPSRFTATFGMTATAYGQMKGGRLMVVKPYILGRRYSILFINPTRSNPIALNAESFRNKVHITLPPGFKLDELPEPLQLDAPFGHYSAKCELSGAELFCSRDLEFRFASVPVEQYAEVRGFFEKILNEEQSLVVLVHE